MVTLSQNLRLFPIDAISQWRRYTGFRGIYFRRYSQTSMKNSFVTRGCGIEYGLAAWVNNTPVWYAAY